MTQPDSRYAPVSVFRRHPKIDDQALIRFVYGFCQGASIAAVAGSLGLSRKTVRAEYLDLRGRLGKPAFRRWHGHDRALYWHVEPDTDRLLRWTFIDVLAECYGNETCYRVFHRGNRKERVCQSCPVLPRFRSPEATAAAVAMVDAVRTFYARLGLREPNASLPRIFGERLIHTSVVAAVRENTKRLPNGLPDPSDQGYLAVGQLLVLLMDDLAGEQASEAPRLGDPPLD